jgi:hypothetical protein
MNVKMDIDFQYFPTQIGLSLIGVIFIYLLLSIINKTNFSPMEHFEDIGKISFIALSLSILIYSFAVNFDELSKLIPNAFMLFLPIIYYIKYTYNQFKKLVFK